MHMKVVFIYNISIFMKHYIFIVYLLHLQLFFIVKISKFK